METYVILLATVDEQGKDKVVGMVPMFPVRFEDGSTGFAGSANNRVYDKTFKITVRMAFMDEESETQTHEKP